MLLMVLFKNKDLSLISNIMLKKNDEIILTEKNKIANKFSLLNYPDRSLVDISKYMDTRTMITSRGCIGKCSFCTTPTFFGVWNGKETNKVVMKLNT